MRVLKKIRDVLFGSLIMMVLCAAPVLAGGPTEEPEVIEDVQQTEEDTQTGMDSQSEYTISYGIYTVRIDLGEQWAGAKFYLDTDSGRVEYVADLLGGVSFKVADASENYTLSPKIQAPPSTDQEMDEVLQNQPSDSDIDSTENVEVFDGNSIGSMQESAPDISETVGEGSETESEESAATYESESNQESELNSQNSNGDISHADPVTETEEVLNITIIILSVIAIGAVLGLVISRVSAAVKRKREEKELKLEEAAEAEAKEESMDESEDAEEDDDEEEEEEDEI